VDLLPPILDVDEVSGRKEGKSATRNVINRLGRNRERRLGQVAFFLATMGVHLHAQENAVLIAVHQTRRARRSWSR
jgi:hypothetical protein